MKLKLPNSVSSPQDIDTLAREVHEYAKWHSHASVKKKAGAKAPKPPEVSEEALELLESWHGKKSMTAKTIDALVDELQDCKKSAPRLTIILAAPPTNDIKSTLIKWCRQNITPEVLVNFRFNRNLLGGMVVRVGSHMYDWSFRRALLENSEQFPEVLRNV